MLSLFEEEKEEGRDAEFTGKNVNGTQNGCDCPEESGNKQPEDDMRRKETSRPYCKIKQTIRRYNLTKSRQTFLHMSRGIKRTKGKG